MFGVGDVPPRVAEAEPERLDAVVQVPARPRAGDQRKNARERANDGAPVAVGNGHGTASREILSACDTGCTGCVHQGECSHGETPSEVISPSSSKRARGGQRTSGGPLPAVGQPVNTGTGPASKKSDGTTPKLHPQRGKGGGLGGYARRAVVPHLGKVETLEDVQRHQRREPLPVGRDLEDLTPKIRRKNRQIARESAPNVRAFKRENREPHAAWSDRPM